MVLIAPVFAYGEKQGSDERKFVTRVIFAEAGPSCSDNERELIASVMVGRIGRQGFDNGKLATMYDVASQPNAFSCINDPKNGNWAKSADPDKLNKEEKLVWDQCDSLAGGNFQQHYGPSGRPLVYYHDKSISKPCSWDNKYWYTMKELETDHFIFYSVVANNAAVAGALTQQVSATTTLTLYIHNGKLSGPAIPQAQVTGHDGSGNGFQQATDSSGSVTITGSPGIWSFSASISGYETNSWSQPITETCTTHAFLQTVTATTANSDMDTWFKKQLPGPDYHIIHGGGLDFGPGGSPSPDAPTEQKEAARWDGKGAFYLADGKWDESIQAFNKATELDPNLKNAWENKGIVLCVLGKYAEALQCYDKSLDIKQSYPDCTDKEIWTYKSLILYILGRYDEALSACEKALELGDNPDFNYCDNGDGPSYRWYVMGGILFRSGRNSESEVAFAKAKELGYSR